LLRKSAHNTSYFLTGFFQLTLCGDGHGKKLGYVSGKMGLFRPTLLFAYAAINTALAVRKTCRASCNKTAGEAEGHPEVEISIL